MSISQQENKRNNLWFKLSSLISKDGFFKLNEPAHEFLVLVDLQDHSLIAHIM